MHSVRPRRVVVDEGTSSIDAYEKHAREFLQCRDASTVGIGVADRWARSLKTNANVIEIACGGGILATRTIIDAGLTLWVIDSSPTLIAVFKDRFPDVPTQTASVLESDLFQRKYAAAISIGLVFLLSEKDQIEMLHRVSKILGPGARFLFTPPVEKHTWTDVNTGHTCISLGRDAYESSLEQAGFRVVGRYEDSGKNNHYEAEKY